MPTKSATAPKTETASETVPESPAVDFNALKPATVSANAVKHTRAGRSDYGDYPQQIKDTASDGTARQVTIPKTAVNSFCNMLRAAAKTVNLGVRRTVTEVDEKNVTVSYRGAELIKRKAKAE